MAWPASPKPMKLMRGVLRFGMTILGKDLRFAGQYSAAAIAKYVDLPRK
jgi:hypothetical protein